MIKCVIAKIILINNNNNTNTLQNIIFILCDIQYYKIINYRLQMLPVIYIEFVLLTCNLYTVYVIYVFHFIILSLFLLFLFIIRSVINTFASEQIFPEEK